MKTLGTSQTYTNDPIKGTFTTTVGVLGTFGNHNIINDLDFDKQETLEEFIKEVLNEEFFTNISEYRKAEKLMELGAKWQQERSYSEEDLRTAFLEGRANYSSFNKWFEQFKKK